ncbi:MAG: HAD-IIIA family hydrolase [Candidatus Omnitrophica bacterium]|nr:HAD-IIIA family hydrolase [Candidatus Omnitrophota bacterium]
MQRPKQAVILAGGRGTRLRPLTDTRPKPMIEFHGKPFMAYLLELLREQGFERVLLCLGYLPKVIQAYCGDGQRFGLSIEYSVSDVEDDTGRRLKVAAPRIEQYFLLMYCDNYWPLRFDALWKSYLDTGAEAMLTVYRNEDGYTKDNVRLSEDGAVLFYDKNRATPRLQGVDIGFGLFRREALELVPDENVSFERVVYPTLVARRTLFAFPTSHRYYSVSSHERLGLTERFLARTPAVILDRDGVLNARPPQGEYVTSWAQWRWLPGAREALRLLHDAGYQVIVISNQAGIARGAMRAEDVETIHRRMREEAAVAGGSIDAIYYCPHHWDDGCACRKPKPGMFFSAQREFHLDLSRTRFYGDDERDGQAAKAAGCPFTMISASSTLLDAVRQLREDAVHG